jgi:hypothetical protein
LPAAPPTTLSEPPAALPPLLEPACGLGSAVSCVAAGGSEQAKHRLATTLARASKLDVHGTLLHVRTTPP